MSVSRTPARSIRNVLVVQPYGIGDALFMTPFLRALRTVPTVERVDLLLGSRTEPIFRTNPHVDEIFSVDKGKWHAEGKGKFFKDAFSLWRRLRSRYDLLIDFSLQREYGFYAEFFLGIPRRIGFNFKNRGIFLTQSLPLPGGFEGAHGVDFYCEPGKFLGLEIEDRFLEFYLSGEDSDEAEKILKEKSVSASSRFVAVAPGGGESWGKDAILKRWPVVHFVEMLSLVKERVDFEGVLVLGSREERALGEEIQRNSPLPVINLCGELSLGGVAALLEKALVFLANDGGLVHLARAVDTPLIAFYGPADPRVYGPYPAVPHVVPVVRQNLPCRPCYSRFRYNSACPDRECLSALSPREVLEFLDAGNFWSFLKKEASCR